MFVSNICKIYILLFSTVAYFICPAQSTSFISQINKLPKELRRDYIINQVKDFYKIDSIKAKQEIEGALIFFKGNNSVYATLLSEQASIYLSIENNLKALEYEQKALKVYENINEFEGKMLSTTKLSRIYRKLNRADEGIDLLLKNLKEVKDNPERECILLERLGIEFKEMKNEVKGLHYLKLADEKSKLIIAPSTKFNQTLLSIYKNIGVLYRNKNDLDKALYYFDKGYALADITDNKRYKGIILNSLGLLFKQKKEYFKAIKAFEASVKFKTEADNIMGISNSFTNIGMLYLEINNLKKAEEYLQKAYTLAIKSNDKKVVSEVCTSLFQFYDKSNKPVRAYPYLKRAFYLKDSIYSANITEESAKLEAIYSAEKNQKEIEINKIKNQQLEKNITVKNRERNFLIIGVFILILFLIWAIWSFIGKRKANSLLEEKNTLINNQKLLVEEKQKEILDSIRYAKKIQNAHLTSENYIQKTLNKLQKNKKL